MRDEFSSLFPKNLYARISLHYSFAGSRSTKRKYCRKHASSSLPKHNYKAGPQKSEPYVLLLPAGKIVGVRTGKVESLDKYTNPYTRVFNIEHILHDPDLYENRNGSKILRYLRKGSKLTDSENNEMVRICCEHLQRCDGSMYPDTEKKEILAKSIVYTFPQLANVLNPTEPHVLYFHRKQENVINDRHSGKISNRFDTIVRKANGKNRYKKPGHVILS
ncbi:uncharacterized protein LOC131434526 [Malaya genurostris]|uniref:uncharacterized protein LOC131434526 n=1 Tax=Malaya genurostris TaxID=325434 RepID=UPI0026F38D13|nr:uncharacterized protein LOC131434526 [Malaya genurostris]